MKIQLARSFCAVVLVYAAVILSVPCFAAEIPVDSTSVAAGRVALSVEGGTLGWGASGWYSFNNSFSGSVGYNGLDYSHDVTTSDVDYSGDLKLQNVPVMLGWHPFKGTFRVVAGVVFGDNKGTLVARPKGNQTYTINHTTYTSAQVGNLLGTADLGDDVAPYAGIGWSKLPLKKGFGVFADLGVMFSGSPKVALNATGPIANDPTFKSNLAAEVNKVNDEIDLVKVYPVIRFGFMYRF
jgi:hypothetical protein